MKKQFYLLIAVILLSISAKALPGDTTWVQAQNIVQFTHPGAYDTTVVFPNGTKTYRKVLMIFTLAEYNCPSGSTYCHQWDYTVQNYLMTKGGDTLELSRFITPYSGTSTRFPITWQNHYIFDVTDFYPLLKDTAAIRVNYEGYSYGFTGDIKFAFIEGTPDKNVTGLQKIYDGYFGYGSATDPINNHLPKVGLNIPASTKGADMRFIVSGHGSDANGCCEFMSHYYDAYLNGISVAHRNIWRPDCGMNEIYPQTGTWIYERANWCPGDIVVPIYHDLPGVIAGGTDSVQIKYENYTIASPAGGYATEAIVFYHGDFNKILDASLDDIIAPTSYEGYFRENPMVGTPIILVKNTGSTTITSMNIQYGIKDSAMLTYAFTGSLAPLQDTQLVLPDLETLRNIAGTGGNYTFVAKITSVNGATDNDATNNTLSTSFTAAPVWPAQIAITMLTNGSTVADGTSETSWRIYDINNNIVKERINNTATTTYKDTVTLNPGTYRLVVTDSGCDGINWWNYANYPVDPGVGTFKVTPATSVVPKPLNGYFSGDFGCGFTQYFSVAGPLGVNNVAALNSTLSISAYPNPAQNDVTVNINGTQTVKGTLSIIDALGRVVLQQSCTANMLQLNTGNLVNGLYTILFTDDKNVDNKLQTRIVIAK